MIKGCFRELYEELEDRFHQMRTDIQNTLDKDSDYEYEEEGEGGEGVVVEYSNMLTLNSTLGGQPDLYSG